MACEITQGLLATPASISPKYFYDERGSKLFEIITQQPEYYLTRLEREIFERHRSDIVRLLPQGSALIDLGAGNCEKAEQFFDALQPNQYVPVDISSDFLNHTIQGLSQRYQNIDIVPVDADYSQGINLPLSIQSYRRVFFYPGSSIGNFTPAESQLILKSVQEALGPDGKLLIGIDLMKPRDVLEPAYNDAQGITAQFNLNVLDHLNHQLKTDFEAKFWSHRAFLNSEQNRIEMHLKAEKSQWVSWPRGKRFFEKDETIHTENSYKYTLEAFRSLLFLADFEIEAYWTDANDWFAVILAKSHAPVGRPT
jgi:dimethylhistidine N-methyltransferase